MRHEGLRFRWDTLVVLTLFHAGAILALYFFEWRLLLLSVPIWILSHGVGLAMGYHRLLIHRGFIVPKWLEYMITICGLLSLQGSHIKWIADHLFHHENTDKAGDPHSPRDGFWWSYWGWVFWSISAKDQEARNKKYASRFLKDPVHFWLHRRWPLVSATLGAILLLVGSWKFLWGIPIPTAFLWGVPVPVVFGLHFTWMVNSVCHRFGTRVPGSTDDSRNNMLVALLTFGEGWHANHHENATRARHGLKWWHIDFSWYFIQTLRFLGLAKGIKV